MLELHQLNGSIEVLDLACGTGRLSHLFALANRLASLDLNYSMLKFKCVDRSLNEILVQSNTL